MKSPHKKLLYNPLAAEFGIKDMAQMNDFIRNEMPRFKMVSQKGIRDGSVDCDIPPKLGPTRLCYRTCWFRNKRVTNLCLLRFFFSLEVLFLLLVGLCAMLFYLFQIVRVFLAAI